MEQIVNLIANYGVTIVIVALFIWDWITNRKDMKNSLEEMAKSNNNTAKSLELLNKSMDNQEKVVSDLKTTDNENSFILKEIQEKTKEILEKFNNK